MARHILYAYVCGTDFSQVAEVMLAEFEQFIAQRTWVCRNPCIVNRPPTSELPTWDLGINIELPDPGNETAGWFSDIIAIANFLASFSEHSKRETVIGIFDCQTGIGEDLHDVRSSDPGIDHLRAIIGVGEIE